MICPPTQPNTFAIETSQPVIKNCKRGCLPTNAFFTKPKN